MGGGRAIRGVQVQGGPESLGSVAGHDRRARPSSLRVCVSAEKGNSSVQFCQVH